MIHLSLLIQKEPIWRIGPRSTEDRGSLSSEDVKLELAGLQFRGREIEGRLGRRSGAEPCSGRATWVGRAAVEAFYRCAKAFD